MDTVMVDRNKPSPTPAMQRPKNNSGRDGAAQKIAEPTANRKLPIPIVYVRDMRSDKYPAAREKIAPVIKMEETTRPCNVGENVLDACQ
jgi:hypothetical protein